MARPCRCAASLRLAGDGFIFICRSLTCFLRSQTANSFRKNVRQVRDLPRIGMAEPLRRGFSPLGPARVDPAFLRGVRPRIGMASPLREDLSRSGFGNDLPFLLNPWKKTKLRLV